jgi:S-adenosylmethionine hydrolase
LSHVLARDPAAEVRAIDIEHLQLRGASRTFHGRDILAPAAGWLSGGRYGFGALGPRLAAPVVEAALLDGSPAVVHVDSFGNAITNVPESRLAGVRAVRVAGREVRLGGTYGEVAPGELLALVGSYGLLEIAQNGGNAAGTLGLQRGAPVELLRA